MKHFDKITCISVVLTLPESWGDPTRMVDEIEGYSLQDFIWGELTQRVFEWPKELDLAHMVDTTCGFDVDCVCFDITDFETEEKFNRTIEWLEAEMEKIYNDNTKSFNA